jgi:hypothetical protein
MCLGAVERHAAAAGWIKPLRPVPELIGSGTPTREASSDM